MEPSMFALEFAFAAELIAAVAATFLLFSAMEKTGFAKKLGSIVGWGALGLSVFTMACTTYYGTSYWINGAFKTDRVTSSFMDSRGMPMGMMQHMWNCQGEGGTFDSCFQGGMMGNMMSPSPSGEEADTH